MLRVGFPTAKRDVRKRSVVWRFFKSVDSGSVQCLLCRECQPRHGQGTTTAMLRHLRVKHPTEIDKKCKGLIRGITRGYSDTEADGEQFCSVEVTLEDGESDNPTDVNKPDIISAVNGSLEAAHGGQAEQLINKEASANCLVTHRQHKRTLIWKHFDHLESLDAARCRICMKKLQCFESGGISNLRQHMSNRHPEVFSSLLTEGHNRQPSHSTVSSDGNDETWTPSETVGATEQTLLSGSRLPDAKERVWRREWEVIEALRRAQKEEARALEHQRELLEKLRAADAREAAAEREKIELLRKVQEEEAKNLSRQREELQKEKTELQKRWKELKQEKEKLLLVPKGQ